LSTSSGDYRVGIEGATVDALTRRRCSKISRYDCRKPVS
jgi:hypothetical protein